MKTLSVVTFIVLTLLSTAANAQNPPQKDAWKLSASSGDGHMAPSKAADGDWNTRWSSEFSDPQWLEIDMGAVAQVCGMTIQWETAYGAKYDIAASRDGDNWQIVYSTDRGDGGLDDFYFQPTEARYLRLLGHERGTGWGYSIHELDIKGPQQQVAVTTDGTNAATLFDGNTDSTWKAPTTAATSIILDFRQVKPFAGVRIDWGNTFARKVQLFASTDGSNWNHVDAPPFGAAEFDVLLHPRTDARYLKLELADPSNDAPVEISEISLADLNAGGNSLGVYKVGAALSPAGVYPEQLRSRQVYWTVVGLPADNDESLLDEYGNLEPKRDANTLMPFVYTGGKLHTPVASPTIEQALVDGHLPLPSVTWFAGDIKVEVEALSRGELNASITYVRYLLTNTANKPQQGKLMLAVRPMQINPSWQHGGLSPIKHIRTRNDGWCTAVEMGNEPVYLVMPPADSAGVKAFDRGDVARDILTGNTPTNSEVYDDSGLASGALAYNFDLAPQEQMAVVAAAPLGGAVGDIFTFKALNKNLSKAFDSALQERTEFWRDRLSGPVIELPDRDITDMLKAQVAYILINQDGPAIQPGSRNYNRSWMRDGGSSMAALLRMGCYEDAHRWLEWYTSRVQPNGLVPPILTTDGRVYTGWGANIEWDAQGEFLRALAEYYRFTGDRDFVEAHFDQAIAAAEYMKELVARTSTPGYKSDQPDSERFRGVLPPSISHEGYDPPVHSNWDNFWGLKGLKDYKYLAELMNRPEIAADAQRFYNTFRASVDRSLRATVDHFNINYIPGCAEKGDFDATSTAIAIFPCGEFDLLDPALLRATFDRYYKELMQRKEPTWTGQFTPYELRSIAALVKLGEVKRANDLLDYMMSCRRPAPWNHLGEVVCAHVRKNSYLGDLPHTWVGAEYVNGVRGMLAQEDGNRLLLLPGVLPRWVNQGNGITIKRLPTYFGELDLTAKTQGNTLTVQLGGKAQPQDGFLLHLPIEHQPKKILIDGKETKDAKSKALHLAPGTREVKVSW